MATIPIDALRAHVAILDHTGAIVAVNERWSRFAKGPGARPLAVGDNYIAICETDEFREDRSAKRIAAGLRRLLDGKATTYGHVHRWSGRIYRLTARHLGEPAGGIIIAHEDITALLRARRERDRSRRSLDQAQRDHAAVLDRAYEELGQRLLAISLAAHSLEQGGDAANAIALIHLAVDEAKHELRRLRIEEASRQPPGRTAKPGPSK